MQNPHTHFRMRLASLVIAIACALACPITALVAHPNPFLGKWHGSSRGDQWQDFTLVLRTVAGGHGGRLSGVIRLEDGSALPLSHISIQGDRIAFQLSSPDGETYRITGRLRNHRLSGAYHSEDSNGTWVATPVHASCPSPSH